MRRTLLAILFFIALVAIWSATAGIADRVFEIRRRHDRRARAWFADAAECLLGAACVAVVRTNRRRDVVCRDHGNGLVGGDRDRHRRAHDSTDLRAGGADNGLRSVSQMGARPFAGVASLSGQRNETGLGVCVAFINGRGNLCNDPHRFWPWSPSPLRPRIKRDGPGDRDHAGDRRDRIVGGQNFVLAVGTFSPPALGHGQSVSCSRRPPGDANGGRSTSRFAEQSGYSLRCQRAIALRREERDLNRWNGRQGSCRKRDSSQPPE